MELFNPSEFSSVKTVSQHIWGVTDVLRKETSLSEYNVVLYLLSLLKEGDLDVFGENHIPSTSGQEVVHYLKQVKKGQDLEVLQAFEYQLLAIPKTTWPRLLEILFPIDREFLSENFSEIFEVVLSSLSHELARKHGEPMQPKDLTSFMVKLADISPNSRIYNPFAGLASFAKEIDVDIDYLGQEILPAIWAMGYLRLKAADKSEKIRFLNDNSLDNWPTEENKYDLLITNPPFSLKLDGLFNSLQHYKQIESFIISTGFGLLKKGGRMIILVPQRFLFSSNKVETNLKKEIVDKGFLRKVISFPAGTLFSTAISFSILELVFEESDNKTVIMMDADNYVSREPKNKKIDVNGLYEAINNETDNGFSRVTVESLKASDYELEPKRYFIKQVKGERLGDICEFVKAGKVNPNESLPIVTISDLKDNHYDQNLLIGQLPLKGILSGYEKIEQSCILVAMRSSKLRPTFFEYKGEPIAILRGSIAAIQITDEKRLSKEFLLNELRSPYVESQVEALLNRATIPFISKKDLLSIRIETLSFEEQRAKVSGVHNMLDEMRILEELNHNLLHHSNELSYERFSTIKHAMGTPLMNLGRGLKNIESALDRNYKGWRKTKTSEVFDICLDDTFRSLQSILSDVHNLLKVNDQHLNLKAYPLEKIDIIEFIKSYQKDQQTAANKNESIELELSSDVTDELNESPIIMGSKDLLKIALGNIISNARKHAFVNDDSVAHKFLFYLDINTQNEGLKDSLYIRLQIRNTGMHFPENFDLEKFKRIGSKAGKTGNTGLGGNQINEIIKYHNDGISTLELDTICEGSEFSTSLSFSLPILK